MLKKQTAIATRHYVDNVDNDVSLKKKKMKGIQPVPYRVS